jgi:hypothetical protein
MTTNIIHKAKPPALFAPFVLFKLLSTAKGRKHLWDTFWK